MGRGAHREHDAHVFDGVQPILFQAVDAPKLRLQTSEQRLLIGQIVVILHPAALGVGSHQEKHPVDLSHLAFCGGARSG